MPGYPPYGPDSANLNLVLRQTPSDPISGSSPLRASVCDISVLNSAAQRMRDVDRWQAESVRLDSKDATHVTPPRQQRVGSQRVPDGDHQFTFGPRYLVLNDGIPLRDRIWLTPGTAPGPIGPLDDR